MQLAILQQLFRVYVVVASAVLVWFLPILPGIIHLVMDIWVASAEELL